MTTEDTKYCGDCDTTKPVEEFYWKKKGKLRQSSCIDCKKAYAKRHYQENKANYLMRASEYKRGQRPHQRAQYPTIGSISDGLYDLYDEEEA